MPCSMASSSFLSVILGAPSCASSVSRETPAVRTIDAPPRVEAACLPEHHGDWRSDGAGGTRLDVAGGRGAGGPAGVGSRPFPLPPRAGAAPPPETQRPPPRHTPPPPHTRPLAPPPTAGGAPEAA